MGSGKSGGGSKDYYGHCAGILCCGQIDSIWGVMINNDVVWPAAKLWDTQIYQKGQTYVISGNVYQTPAKTEVDPPSAPWALIATTWTAGTYAAGTLKLYSGYLWKAATGGTSLTPPAAPTNNQYGQPDGNTAVNGWIYVSTPPVFGGGVHHWDANSIVSWLGRLYTTPSATSARPPASPWVLWKTDRATSPNPLKFTIKSYGDCYLYWGTATQTLDTVNEQILNALGHPPYRNRAVLMLKNFLFGTGTINPPDVTVLALRSPVQSLIINNTGATGVDATAIDADWQVNPWCVLAELLTHPVIGLGLPTSWFDATTWQAEADRCALNPSLYYISPIYTDMKKIREIVADLLSYPDAFIFWSTLATLTAGHWPHAEAAPAFDGTNTITRDQVVEEFNWDSDGWGATYNNVEVSFNDIEAAFRSRPVIAPNLFNRTVLRRLQTQRVDRPHIVRSSQAAQWANEFAKLAGDQIFKGNLSIRAETATAVTPGKLFLLTDDVLQTSQIQRCTSRTIGAPPAGRVKIGHESERGVSPQPYSPTPVNPTSAQGPSPSPILDAAIFQLPDALAGEPNAVAVLAARTNDQTSALEVWFQQADGAAYQSLGVQRGFAVGAAQAYHATETITINNPVAGQSYQLTHGGLAINGAVARIDIENQFGHGTTDGSLIEGQSYYVDYANGIVTVDAGLSIAGGTIWTISYVSGFGFTPDASTPQSDLDAITAALTVDQVQDNEILLFVDSGAYGYGVGIFSVCAVQAWSGLPGTYKVFTIPVYGTRSDIFWPVLNLTRSMFIIKRSDITSLTHESFAGLASAGATANFILAPQSAWVAADHNDLYDPASNPSGLSSLWQLTFANLFAPTTTLLAVQQNGTVVTDFLNTNFATTDSISVVAEVKDSNFDINKLTLTAYLGDQQVTLLSQTVQQTGDYTFTAKFSLPLAGAWDIVCAAGDAAGNASQTTLCTLHVKNATYPLPPPALMSYTQSGGFITKLEFKTPNTFGGAATTGLTVQYQLTARGAAPAGGSWTNVTGSPSAPTGYTGYGPIPNYARETYTLWAKSTKAGSNDSTLASWNL